MKVEIRETMVSDEVTFYLESKLVYILEVVELFLLQAKVKKLASSTATAN